jgi:zona occludens toxin (predicted ATPase)
MIGAADFKEAFEAAFTVHRRHLLWDTNSRRTAYMMAYIYRTIADCFPGVEIEYEHHDIDAVLYRDQYDDRHIEVAIEHENDVRSISTELTNLEKYQYPLSVVITYRTSARIRVKNSRMSRTRVQPSSRDASRLTLSPKRTSLLLTSEMCSL